ncbi:phage major tail tube protein [Brevibacillus laterosporus]|uniref:phage major tail tube protein n=1 Tax=Brevibacillus laterosporus TaxID=1465 RepID=UPI0018CF6F35|nr:phage major tail tube protein [Brevibacillus laterosporus]MBG9799532.1 tail protein [Brevibacillus laterosporus]MED1909746.1 phage major tail tube protein [Brevibacillus laterosporus]
MKKIPDKLISYTAYLDGSEYLGIVDVQLPDLESLTESIKGAGIAGDVEMPVLGHFGSMTVTLNWRTVNTSAIRLARQKSHSIDFRGSQQQYNSGTGDLKPTGVKVSIKGFPKKTSLGKFEIGATTDTSNEMEVTYLKVEVDGKKRLEIDKFNFIAVIDGVDELAEVREQLGY